MRFPLVVAASMLSALALAPSARAAWQWPLRGEVVTSYRNGSDPYAGGQHRGIDIAGPIGARVVAAAGGQVRFAGTVGSSGLTVSVRTTDGFDTSYLHLSSLAVREGDAVSPGQALGAVGTTGRRSTSQPHLHFGVREAGSRHAYRNPLDFLPPPPIGAPGPEPRPLPLPAPVARPQAPAPATGPVGDQAPGAQPVGEPAGWRVPAGRRIPRRGPAAGKSPRPVPVGNRDRGRAPATAPQHLPTSQPAAFEARPPLERHSGRVTPEGSPSGTAGLHTAPEAAASAHPGGRPALGPAGSPRVHRAAGPADRAAEPARPGRAGSGAGPDIGWILACAGLLLAVGLLALSADGRNAVRNVRGAVGRILRQLGWPPGRAPSDLQRRARRGATPGPRGA
jgi:hypothetical protein